MIIEEFMTGREVSVLSFVDGKTIKIMTSAQDHKRAKDGDQGLNTLAVWEPFLPVPFIQRKWMTSATSTFIRLLWMLWRQKEDPLRGLSSSD